MWALQQEVLAEGRWFLRYPDEVPEPVETVRSEIARHAGDPGSLFLVARRSGSIIGALTLTRPPLRRLAHLAHLEVFLHADHRGVGLGRGLVSCGMDWAESNPELRKVSLAVYAHNERAIALYRRLGFTEEGRRRDEVRSDDGSLLDDVLMARFV